MSLESLDYNENLTMHQPVMPAEVMQWLGISQKNGIFVDGTTGGGGHSALIAAAIKEPAQLLAMDRDPAACRRAEERLQPWINMGRVRMICGTIDSDELATLDGKVDGILLDLGLSSDQLNTPQRGFSFSVNGPLDMRMNATQGPTAADLLNQYSSDELRDVFKNYGDEPKAMALARNIVNRRDATPFTETQQLVDVILGTLRPRNREMKLKFLARNFMALRMAVNQELQLLETELRAALRLLRPGGRLVVISFHSGEDRVVKNFFRDASRDCVCPHYLPQCVCNHRAELKVLTKKPLRPSKQEMRLNSRSRSALLRVAERCANNEVSA